MSRLKLDKSQEDAVREIIERIKNFTQISTEQDLAHNLGIANAFGVLGERGSGKSTILNHLYNRNKTDNEKKTDYIFLPLLDCSVVPPECPPGLVVLLHLKKIVQFQDNFSTSKSKKQEEVIKQLTKLISLYTQIGQDYRDLCLDLSSGPDDYGHYVTQGLEARLELRDSLTKWLGIALDAMNHKAFVVLLDDFDLVGVGEVRRWLFSLLDELRQSQLIFVLTADYHRLEHLSLDINNRFDDITGRALMDKLLPSQNRINLGSWETRSRIEFPLLEKKEDNLWARIHKIVKNKGSLEMLTLALLPKWPRGLHNLYHTLDVDSAINTKRTDTPNIHYFSELLATCRGESLLAKRLQETNGVILDLNLTESLWEEQWRDLVDQAYQRPTWKNEQRLSPLPHLLETLSTDKQTVTPVQSSQDPLRHEHLYRHPLRDAVQNDHPLWAELLIDSQLHDCSRNRALFSAQWKPLLSRLKQAKLTVSFSNDELRHFFFSHSSQMERSMLYWLYHPSSSEQTHEFPVQTEHSITLEIGWYSLLEALRGERDSLSTRLLSMLDINIGQFIGHTPDDEETLNMLPNKLWALIVLADALDRCPWRALSAVKGHSLLTYLGLSAALVRSAYIYALVEAQRIKKETLSTEQQQLVECLSNRDPLYFQSVQQQEEETWEKLNTLFSDNLVETLTSIKEHAALCRSARTFLESPVYCSIVTLLKTKPKLT